MVTVSTSWPFSESDSADVYVFGHGVAEGGGDVRVELVGGSVVEDGKGDEEEESEGGEDHGENDENDEEPELHASVRSIKSFESMMSERGGKKWARKVREVGSVSLTTTTVRTTSSGPRKSLSDWLAHMPVLAGIKVSFSVCLAGFFCAHVFGRVRHPCQGLIH